MNLDSFYAWSIWAMWLPLQAIVMILAHFLVRRALWRRRARLSKGRQGYYPSTVALGMALQFMQVFTRPSVAYVLNEKQKEEAEEDDNGDPESPQARLRQFHRQLRRIRRGEPVDRLVLRM